MLTYTIWGTPRTISWDSDSEVERSEAVLQLNLLLHGCLWFAISVSYSCIDEHMSGFSVWYMQKFLFVIRATVWGAECEQGRLRHCWFWMIKRPRWKPRGWSEMCFWSPGRSFSSAAWQQHHKSQRKPIQPWTESVTCRYRKKSSKNLACWVMGS